MGSETEEGEEICRLCLSKNGSMESIFADSKYNLSNKIWECTSILVLEIEGVPSFICEFCKSKLIICSQFIKQCVKTNDLISNIYCEQIASYNRKSVEELEDTSESKGHVLNVEVSAVEIGTDENTEAEKHQEEDVLYEIEVESDNEGNNNEILEEVQEDPELEVLEVKDVVHEKKLKTGNDNDMENELVVVTTRTRSSKIFQKKEKDAETSDSDYGIEEKNVAEEMEMNVLITTNNRRSKTYKGLKTFKIIDGGDGGKVRYKTECHICGIMQQNIKQHMQTHTGEKRFKCNYCEKQFAQRGNFNHHINIHTENRPYRCEDCGKGFKDPNSLKFHKITHTKERNYSCEICGKDFGYPHSLAAHKKTHFQDNKDHKCDICSKMFLQKHSLKRHFRIHTGERPFICEICSKGFTSSGNLSMHRRVHTKERPFKCDFCNLDFSYKSVLNVHMRIHVANNTNNINSNKD